MLLWRLEDVTALEERNARGLRQMRRLMVLDVTGSFEDQRLPLARTWLDALHGTQAGAQFDEAPGCFVDESRGFLERADNAGGISGIAVRLLLAGRLVGGRVRLLSLRLI